MGKEVRDAPRGCSWGSAQSHMEGECGRFGIERGMCLTYFKGDVAREQQSSAAGMGGTSPHRTATI